MLADEYGEAFGVPGNPIFVVGGRGKVSDTILIGTGAPHSAGDVVSTDEGEVLEFDCSSILAKGASGIILSSLVTLNQNAVFASGAGYTLHLFNVSPTVQADNAAFNLAVADVAGYIGSIAITTLEVKGDTCAILDKSHNLDFNLAATSQKLYGKLVCKGAETTISEKTIGVNLGVMAL